jgi:hypothetical protein
MPEGRGFRSLKILMKVKVRQKVIGFILVFALLLTASDIYAADTSYDMFVYSDLHYSYILQGIEVQKKILNALVRGELLPVYIIVFVYCIFMWVRRIAEKGEVMNFAVWFLAFFIVSYMAFYAKTNININIYAWEEAKKDDSIRYITTIKDAPGINSFFAQASKFVTVLSHVILSKITDKDTNIGSCDPMDWYVKATRSFLMQVYKDKGPDKAAVMLRNLKLIDHKTVDRALKEKSVAGKITRPEHWETFMTLVRENAKKCNIPDSPDKTDLETIKKNIENAPLDSIIFKEFQEALKKVDDSKLKPIGETVDDLGDTNSFFLIDWARNFFNFITRVAAKVQPGLDYKIYVMLLVQAIATAFILLLFPLFLLYSFIAIDNHNYGINFRMLLSFLFAFFLVQLWYPAIMFIKALVFKQFII